MGPNSPLGSAAIPVNAGALVRGRICVMNGSSKKRPKGQNYGIVMGLLASQPTQHSRNGRRWHCGKEDMLTKPDASCAAISTQQSTANTLMAMVGGGVASFLGHHTSAITLTREKSTIEERKQKKTQDESARFDRTTQDIIHLPVTRVAAAASCRAPRSLDKCKAKRQSEVDSQISVMLVPMKSTRSLSQTNLVVLGRLAQSSTCASRAQFCTLCDGPTFSGNSRRRWSSGSAKTSTFDQSRCL